MWNYLFDKKLQPSEYTSKIGVSTLKSRLRAFRLGMKGVFFGQKNPFFYFEAISASFSPKRLIESALETYERVFSSEVFRKTSINHDKPL